jgi:hypothetical protein
MKEISATPIVRRGLEKSPACRRTGIVAPIVSGVSFWETNRKSKCRELWPKTSIRNPAPAAVELPIFPTSRRLYSSLAIATFGRKGTASSLCDCGVSALAAPRRSTPASSSQTSREPGMDLLPHENETQKNACVSIREFVGFINMNQKANLAGRCGRRKQSPLVPTVSLRPHGVPPSEALQQIMRGNVQCLGYFHQRIHRRRFFAAFNPADENGRKTRFFGQPFLGEIGTFTFGTNGFAQQTAVMLAGQHVSLKNGKRVKAAMSLTTILSLPVFGQAPRIRTSPSEASAVN